jgi:hypothetical protein
MVNVFKAGKDRKEKAAIKHEKLKKPWNERGVRVAE